MNQRELKQSIEENPNLTDSEKARKLNALCAPLHQNERCGIAAAGAGFHHGIRQRAYAKRRAV